MRLPNALQRLVKQASDNRLISLFFAGPDKEVSVETDRINRAES
jgi:hypothetical protein